MMCIFKFIVFAVYFMDLTVTECSVIVGPGSLEPANQTALEDEDTTTCSAFNGGSFATRRVKIRVEERVCAAGKRFDVFGQHLSTPSSSSAGGLYLYVLTESQTDNWLGKWHRCELQDVAIYDITRYTFLCVCPESTCPQVQLLYYPKHDDRSDWTLCGLFNNSASDIRLVDGDANSGRLEVYVDGTWGTVCDNGFDDNDARVACRQLGYCGGSVLPADSVPDGTLPIAIDELQCSGTENSLATCPHGGSWVHNCGHDEDVGVTCT